MVLLIIWWNPPGNTRKFKANLKLLFFDLDILNDALNLLFIWNSRKAKTQNNAIIDLQYIPVILGNFENATAAPLANIFNNSGLYLLVDLNFSGDKTIDPFLRTVFLNFKRRRKLH